MSANACNVFTAVMMLTSRMRGQSLGLRSRRESQTCPNRWRPQIPDGRWSEANSPAFARRFASLDTTLHRREFRGLKLSIGCDLLGNLDDLGIPVDQADEHPSCELASNRQADPARDQPRPQIDPLSKDPWCFLGIHGSPLEGEEALSVTDSSRWAKQEREKKFGGRHQTQQEDEIRQASFPKSVPFIVVRERRGGGVDFRMKRWPLSE